jgi:hypothetical protein
MTLLVNKAMSGEPLATRIVSRHMERLQIRFDVIAATQPIDKRMANAEDLSDDELATFIAAGTTNMKSGDPDR